MCRSRLPLLRVAPKCRFEREEVGRARIQSPCNGANVLQRRISQPPLYAGEVGHVNAGAVSHLFLGGTTLHPNVAYVSAKCRLISVHLTRKLPTHRLSVHRL